MNSSRELILLIEDDPNDVLLFEKAVANSPFKVDVVVLNDGEKAITFLSQSRPASDHPQPDLVLLDLKLPKKSGFEVLTWIKQHPDLKVTPVVILSSSKQAQDLETAYQLGANSYLVKPTGFFELNTLVEDLGSYWLVHNQSFKR